MSETSAEQSGIQLTNVLLTIVAIVIVGVVGATFVPSVRSQLGLGSQDPTETQATADDGHAHDEHDHGHGPSVGEEIEISAQGRGNLGLKTQTVALTTYTQYVSVPATIVDWPGRTHISVTAPLTGVVNAIYISRGELIRSGQPLFSLRLTHQDLVKTQSDYLAALGRLDVEEREIQRLAAITQSGAVPRKTLIEHEYEHDRLLAELRAEKQALLLHGLTDAQIEAIESTRQLVREVTIYAPTLHGDDSLHHESEHPIPSLPPGEVPVVRPLQQAGFTTNTQPDPDRSKDHAPAHEHEHVEVEFLVTELNVNRGQSVAAGESLGRLSDYSSVLIEGHAFQKDATSLRMAAKFGFPLQAVLDSASQPEIVDGLKISYIGNEVGIQSRALPFFVPLENQVERDEQRGQQRYVSWKYKPGTRLHLRVPLQGFDNTFVVPKDAVAEEGVERYVFVDHGDHFDRRPVRVLARDEVWAAIKNDGSLRAGETIATAGAHQLQMEMKNRSSGPVDPHAGHSH